MGILENQIWISDWKVSCSLKTFTGFNSVSRNSVWKSSHFLLCLNPLYSYVLICSKLYSPGSFSNFETATLLQTLKGWTELIANCAFSYSPLATFSKMAHVCLMRGVTFLWCHLCTALYEALIKIKWFKTRNNILQTLWSLQALTAVHFSKQLLVQIPVPLSSNESTQCLQL